MQLSPLQLNEMRFMCVSIEVREPPDLTRPDVKFDSFAFDDTRFSSTLEHICAEESDEQQSTNFAVTLSVVLPDDGENPPPYVVNVKCVGYFSISKVAFPDFERRYDVGVVNGASLLYGAIREMISNVTARSWYGQLLLPSMNFQAYAPSKGGHEDVPEVEAKVKAKPARRKKEKV